MQAKWSDRVINSKIEFAAIVRTGARAEINGIGFIYRRNNLGYARFAVSVAKKRLKTAVMRNYFKRIHRELFRLQVAQDLGIDIIVIPIKTSFVDAATSWNQLCQFLANY